MPAPTLLLSRSTIAELAGAADYLDAVHRAFADLAADRYELAAVGHLPAERGAFHVKATSRKSARSLAVLKVNGNFPDNPRLHGLPTIQGFIALLDAQRGCVLALMDSAEITARRTAAATALAARHLARAQARTLAVIGCGAQARHHVDALLHVAAIECIQFCDPRDDAATAFASYVDKLPVAATRARDASTAARGADVVVTLTPSTRPILGLADITPGTFVAGVGADNPSKHELSPELLRESRVVADVLAQSATMGDLHHAIRLGAMTAADAHGELADVISGRVTGRTNDAECFVFDSTGVAIEDLAAAEMIYDRACRRGGVPEIALNDS